MNTPSVQSDDRVSRRAVLATGTCGIVNSLAGCTTTLPRVISGDTGEQLSITILTLPADSDEQAIQIARRFEENLKAVGIDTRIEPRSDSELLRAVLLNHDFDCYISPHPGGDDPQFLYEMFYSMFAPEAGWQNPFGFTDSETDELLKRQRTSEGENRREAVGEVLCRLAQTHPTVPICIPDDRRLVRSDRFDGWNNHNLGTRHGFLDLEPKEVSVEDGDEVILTAVITDPRPSQNINPLAASYRHHGPFVDLLYDSLAIDDAGEIRPWLAESWEWNDGVATVTLRPDCRFHDDELITAEDVAFTYEFLSDTTLGERDSPSPTPKYRGRADAVKAIEAVGERTVEIRLETSAEVGELAFVIPVLPKHIWKPAVEERLENSAEPTQGKWTAITADSMPRIGSGPYAFVNQEPRSQLRFERFDDHFTLREAVALPAPTVDTLVFRVEPNSGSAIDQLEAGNADVTASTLGPNTIGDIPDNLELLERKSPTFYHVGFNVRNSPFSNPHFRENVARLIDRKALVEEIFSGRAMPTVTPVAREWVPDVLEWDGEAPYAPFFRAADELRSEESGSLDVEAAKQAFEQDGFQYDDDRERLMKY